MATNNTNTMHQYSLWLEQPFNYEDFATAATIAAIAPKLPVGAIVLQTRILVETVFNGGAASSLSVGIAGTTTKYANAVDLDAATGLIAGATATGIPLTAEEVLVLTPSANAIASTAGKGRILIEYIRVGRGNEVQI
jgi:hypothetical protein